MRMIQRLVLVTGLILAASAMVGCDLFFGSGRVNSSGGKVTVTVSANGEYSASSFRTVMPSTNPEISSYELFGALSGNAQSSLGSWTTLSGASVALDTGTWDFTLEAKNADGDVFLSGSQNGIFLSGAAVVLSFTLEPLASGTGTVGVTVTWPSTVSVASAVPQFNGTVDSSLGQNTESSTTSVTYSTTIGTGKYLFTLSLKDSSGNLLASVSELVRVYANMASTKTISLSESDFNSAPDAPSGVTVTPIASVESTGSVLVSWTDNSNNETGFEISDGTTTLATVAPAATSATVIGLTRDSSYTLEVRATNSFGASAYSSAASAYTVPALLSISFDANGGTGTMTAQIVESGTGASLNSNTFTRTNYGFSGWASSASSTSAEYVDGAIYNMGNADVTLYAVWWTTPVSDFTYTILSGSAIILKYDGHATSVIIPDTIEGYPVTTLNSSTLPVDGVFAGNTSIASVYIPSSVTSIGSNAFYSCRALGSVPIPSSVTNIGNSAFFNCLSLNSVTIPSSVTSIGSNVFDSCTSLAAFTVDQANANYSSVDGVLFDKTRTNLIVYPAGKTAAEYVIPSSVTSIDENAFAYCASLNSVSIPNSISAISAYMFNYCTNLSSVDIPDSVTSIGENAFYNCNSLSSITFPLSLRTIGHLAFYNCLSLSSVSLGNSVTSIGNTAFSRCLSLASVYVNATTPPTLGGSWVFSSNKSGRLIYVPSDSVSAYQTATYWSEYASAIRSQ